MIEKPLSMKDGELVDEDKNDKAIPFPKEVEFNDNPGKPKKYSNGKEDGLSRAMGQPKIRESNGNELLDLLRGGEDTESISSFNMMKKPVMGMKKVQQQQQQQNFGNQNGNQILAKN